MRHLVTVYSTHNRILFAVRWLPVSREFILQEGIRKSNNYVITIYGIKAALVTHVHFDWFLYFPVNFDLLRCFIGA